MKRLLITLLLTLLAITAWAGPEVEYVRQELEPTGGLIERPVAWFHNEAHNRYSWVWTLSREDASVAPYDVGVRIQAIPNVEKLSGKTPRQFIADFRAKKKVDADKVVKDCDESKQGLFSRICLETEEGRFHILYSLFWSDEADMIVVVTSGAPKEEWQDYTAVFDHMSAFRLIDMSKLSSAEKEQPPASDE